MIDKAFILAAGLGTRLRPHTFTKPKALVEVKGKPMLGHLIHRIARYGIYEFVINVHHFADQIEKYLKRKEFKDYSITISDERSQLLDTGGAIIKAHKYLKGDKPVLVHNVDIWSDINLYRIVYDHNKYKSLATLAVSSRDTSRYLLFNRYMSMIGWEHVSENKILMSRENHEVKYKLAFSGIQVLSQNFFNMMQSQGKFSVIEEYLRLSKGFEIRAWEHKSSCWADIGKPWALKEINERVADF